jgi:arylsulfatase A-like enzyme
MVAALLGGLFGGELAGVAEVAMILSTSAEPEEYWLVPYAIASYGALGIAAGASIAALRLVLRRWSATAAFALGCGLSVVTLVLVVGHYHVTLRVFHEGLVLVSGVGVAVLGGLLVAGVVLGALSALVGRWLYTRLSASGLAAAMLLVLGGAIGFAAASHPQDDAVLTEPRATATGPNLILIVADTLRADALGPYGGKPGVSPVLDAFARDAVVFERAYAQASWTRPSIASILTSLYPSAHGAVRKLDLLPDRVLSMAEALFDEGYWTTGIVTNINLAPIFNFQQGFGEYRYLPPAFYFWATDSVTRLAIYKGLRAARERFGASRKYFYNYYQDAEVVVRAVKDWVERKPPTPFFLLIHYMDPHDPFFTIPYNGYGIARANLPNPPKDLRDEMHELYLQNVSYLDRHLGELFDYLRRAGLYDQSVIALVADHGEEFLEHGGWWHGTTLYEEQVHVPLVVKRANEPAPGSRRSDVVRTIDLAPTMMTAAGLPVPGEFMGRDLFSGAIADEPLFAEEDLEGNALASIRVGDWKLITANPGNPRGLQSVELYDLGEDPGEQRNQAAGSPEKVAALLKQLSETRVRIASRSSGQRLKAKLGVADRRS